MSLSLAAVADQVRTEFSTPRHQMAGRFGKLSKRAQTFDERAGELVDDKQKAWDNVIDVALNRDEFQQLMHSFFMQTRTVHEPEHYTVNNERRLQLAERMIDLLDGIAHKHCMSE